MLQFNQILLSRWMALVESMLTNLCSYMWDGLFRQGTLPWKLKAGAAFIMKVIMTLHEDLPAKGLSHEGIMHGILILEGHVFLCVLLSTL